jgi:predicted enzyme related to lactoylglutathione lyase
MEVTEHAPGTFCWVELTTSDAAGAKSLYNKLFGWDYVDNPMGPDMVYTMCQLGGKSAGALYEAHDPNNPPHWGLYIRVESANAAAAKAKELGGNVLMEPFDVMEHGRMAAIADPTGAIFCVWEPKQHIGYEAVGVPGTHCWSELLVPDTAKAKAFYSGLFGWTVDESMGYYTMFKPRDGGMAIAGMMQLTPEMGPMPPNWTPYFVVENADATVETATANGARVLHGPEDVPGMVRFATVMDAAGAVFGVFHPLGNPEGCEG